MCKFALWITMGALTAVAEGKGLQMKDLPAAVQKTVQDNLKGGEDQEHRKREGGWDRAIRD